MTAAGRIRVSSPQGKLVVAAAVLGSGMAFIDSTAVTVALPRLAEDLDAGVAGMQWVTDAYLLTLVAFLLTGGSIGDRLGRRRVYITGVVWFAGASVACAVAPTAPLLIAARAVQGAGAALMVPLSLAIVSAAFVTGDRPVAVGAWSGLTTAAAAAGPLIGGALSDAASWRLIFLVNVPLAAAAVLLAVRAVPADDGRKGSRRPDVAGSLLGAAALSAGTYALIEGPTAGTAIFAGTGAAAIVLSAAFIVVQARIREPMLPLSLFRSRDFSGANGTTLLVYFALGGLTFFLAIVLQRTHGYSAFEAGAALFPLPLLVSGLSSTMGRLLRRMSPRWPMTAGPLVAAAGIALLAGLRPGDSYAAGVLPGAVVFGFGMALTVVPLTSTALESVEEDRKGIAAGVNNALARLASLLAIAVLPIAAGISGEADVGGDALSEAFRRAMWVSAAAAATGGVVALAAVRRGRAARQE